MEVGEREGRLQCAGEVSGKASLSRKGLAAGNT